eukprot:6467795-Amphidinium_carterae.4
MTTLPAMLCHGHLVEEYMTVLRNLPEGDSSLDKLLEIVKKLSTLMSTLRAGTTDQLQVLFMTTLRKLWSEAKESMRKRIDKQKAQAWSVLLAETSTCWPLDTDVAAMVVDSSLFVQKAGQENLLLDLSDACTHLFADGQIDDEIGEKELAKAVEQLWKSLANISLPRDVLESSPSTLESLKSAGKTITGHAVKFIGVDRGSEAVLGDCKMVLHDLGEKMCSPEWKPNAILFGKAVDLLSAYNEHKAVLKDALCMESYKPQLQAVSGLKRALLQLSQVDVQKANMEPHLQDAVRAMVEEVNVKHDQRKNELLLWAKNALTGASKAGEEVALGAPDGKNWLQDFQGKNFDNLMTHWCATMALLDGSNLVKLKEQLQEALCLDISILVVLNCPE